MTQPSLGAAQAQYIGGGRDLAFAAGVVVILAILFLPLPPILIDFGLAISIACSILILMVALWVQRPLEFSSFPTVLLIVTMLRLALNIATSRLILSDGVHGPAAAGYVISGFAQFVMGGDFLIGVIVFLILLTVNFIVITKGASRIAEVGARFALDAIPGKQMAIDADLSAGLIDERTAQARRRELEEESSFFGAMDGASKFVRGDAIAALIITAINAIGGVVVGTLRHEMALLDAVDSYVKLAVGDGLVSQIPALIISLAAGLVVAKGGARGSVEMAVLGQLGGHPRALTVTSSMMAVLSLVPGLPFLPFALLALIAGGLGYSIPRKQEVERQAQEAVGREKDARAAEEVSRSGKVALKIFEIEVEFGQQLSALMLRKQDELGPRVAKLRQKFARQYGFVVPEVQFSDNLTLSPRGYRILIHGAAIASDEIRIGDVLVVVGDGPRPSISGVETIEPAFGLKALWISEVFAKDVRREGFTAVDPMTILLTHLSEVIRNNLGQLFSYGNLQNLLESFLDPEYRKLLDEIRPAHISMSGIQGVLKNLLSERVSIRNMKLILEAIAEIAPHSRRIDHVSEHVRQRLGQQLCGDLATDGVLSIVKLGARWDVAFHEGVRRDQRGDVIDFELDPRIIEEFGRDAQRIIKQFIDASEQFAIVTSAEARPYVRMVIERMFPTTPVLSHAEIARGVKIRTLGSLS